MVKILHRDMLKILRKNCRTRLKGDIVCLQQERAATQPKSSPCVAEQTEERPVRGSDLPPRALRAEGVASTANQIVKKD